MDARIRVHDHSNWVCKQSKHAHLPSLPSMGIVLGPSASGKSTTRIDDPGLVQGVLCPYHNHEP